MGTLNRGPDPGDDRGTLHQGPLLLWARWICIWNQATQSWRPWTWWRPCICCVTAKNGDVHWNCRVIRFHIVVTSLITLTNLFRNSNVKTGHTKSNVPRWKIICLLFIANLPLALKSSLYSLSKLLEQDTHTHKIDLCWRSYSNI